MTVLISTAADMLYHIYSYFILTVFRRPIADGICATFWLCCCLFRAGSVARRDDAGMSGFNLLREMYSLVACCG